MDPEPIVDSDPEDILSSSLGTLYDYTAITHSSAGSIFTYKVPSVTGTSTEHIETSSEGRTITLTTPDTQAANWHLHASSIWVSSLFLAGHLNELNLASISRGRSQPLFILELGASAGLPGILIAKSYNNIQVTVSDYPDEDLMSTLADNVHRNEANDRCCAVPYAWGSDAAPLLSRGAQQAPRGFDVIIAADTLWNPESHPLFIRSLEMTLRRTEDARVHLVAGLHTGRYTLEAFLKAVQNAGFEMISATERAVEGHGMRLWNVGRAEVEDDKERRKWVLWIVLKWGDNAMKLRDTSAVYPK